MTYYILENILLQVSLSLNLTSDLTILPTIRVHLSTSSASILVLGTSVLKVITALVRLRYLLRVVLEHTMMKRGNETVRTVPMDITACPGLCPLPTTHVQVDIIV